MAGSIKGITIEFRGNPTPLKSAIRDIEKETAKLDKEIKQVDKALKFNPTNVDLWRQKQQLLTQKISETKEKLSLLKNEQARLDAAGVDKNSEEYRKLQREIIETESKLKTFEGQLKAIGNVNLRAASEQMKQLGTNLTNAGEAMRGLSVAAAAVTAAIGALTVKSGQWADDMNTMSKRYSISTQDLQKYSAAADLVDVSVEDIAKTHVKLEKSMLSASKGTGSQAEAFDKLGVSVTDSNGELRDADEVWQETIAKLGEMTNETERDALAQQLLGKTAANLNPLIEDGGETYKRVAETMQKYGLDFIDQETLDRANEFNDELDTIKAIGLVTFQSLGTELAGYLAPAIEKVVGWVGKFAEWLSKLSPQTLTVIAAVAGVLAVVSPLLIGLGKLSFAISSIMSLAATIGPAIGGILAAAGPVVLVIAAIVAAGVLLYKNWDKIKAKAKAFKDKLVSTFEQMKKKVENVFKSIKDTATKVFNAVKLVVTTVFNTVKTIIKTVVMFIFTLIQARFNLIKTIVTTVFNEVKKITTTVWNGVKTIITTVVTAIQTLITARFNLIRTTITTVLNAIRTLFTTVWNGIKTIVTTVVSAIQTYITNQFNAMRNTITNVLNGVKNVVSSVWNSIKSTISNAISGAHSAVSSKVSAISSAISSTFNSIKSTATSIWNSIKSAITSPLESAKNTVSNIMSKIKGFFPINVGKLINFSVPKISLNTSSRTVLGKTITYPTGFSVSWHKQGAIFARPMLLPGMDGTIHGVGDVRGGEAVLPIEKLQTMIDKGMANNSDATLRRAELLLLNEILNELKKEKNFKIDDRYAGRYVRSLGFVKG